MINKNNTFFLLKEIEEKNVKKLMININNLYYQKNQHVNQLNMLKKYEKEYIQEFRSKCKLGIFIYQWKNYSDFILNLHATIQDTKRILLDYDNNIKKSITQWLKNTIQLKTWNYFDKQNNKKIIQYKFLKEQILYDEFVQLKFLSTR